MTASLAARMCASATRASVAMLLTGLSIFSWGSTTSARTQSDPRAEANQLHAAIVNADIESLGYWLTVRHADASAANAAEPDVTPLERCVALASRTLDGRDTSASAPVVSLRTLQTMAALLYEHGARLTEAERSQFSAPVLRWYDDAVSPSGATAPTQSKAQPEPARAATGHSSKPALTLDLATVLLRTEPREACNGTGHAVYLVNQTQMTVTANVTTFEDAAGTTSGRQKSEGIPVDADSAWRLGCSASRDGRGVRYVLNGWR